ncbi:hypothetical protein [Sulfuracidifex metallicus]|uniref:Uncharacterized protein n=1 Tax=Sulfuracidifex metallicus DSM 6482 = JCM 9184 TaxID=523847 RepID=A0A6A9QLA8_SULME|nr:hypothetical protein [Sulfuracidifex metallicus]MUN29776.1 hypothetical protein [Sulfuracidifex metallicus DSM 6482 = JCM 9184]WOE51843.1 hypothetical protein RQ359_001179 [Sulfuracidifex metallicus DSM 6482 = JCM 9184]
MSNELDIIREAKKQTYKFLLRKGRKAMAMYYLMWSIYSLSLTVAIPLLYSLIPQFYVLLLIVVLMSIPNYYTAKIFYVLIRSYLLLYKNSITSEIKFRKTYVRSYVIRSVSTYLFIFLSYFFKPLLFLFIMASVPLFIIVERNLYKFLFTNEFRITEGKFYDKIAIYTLNLIPITFSSLYLYYIFENTLFYFASVTIDYIFGILWLIFFALSMSDLVEANKDD